MGLSFTPAEVFRERAGRSVLEVEVRGLEITPGQIVYSKAGRDASRVFIVLDVLNGSYALIADGELRKVEKPKKKKIKHLAITGYVAEELGHKLTNKVRVTNSEIKKTLRGFKEQSANEGKGLISL